MIAPGSLMARLVFAAAVLFSFIMATTPQPPHLPIDNLGDKFQHAMAFAVLTLLAIAAYPRTPLLRIAERLSFFGAMIEVVQSIPALHRDCDIMDWVTDTAAILIVMGLFCLSRHALSDRKQAVRS